MERELLKGTTPGLILAVLEDGPLHGYGVAREIERRAGGGLKFKEGTLYPALHALEAGGWVSSQWEVREEGPGRPSRKSYTLTEEGRGELKRRRALWNRFSQAIGSALGQGRESGGEVDAA